MAAAWSWLGVVKGTLCGSPGFPDTEDEVFLLPLGKVLMQLQYLAQLDDVEHSEHEAEKARMEQERRKMNG